MLSIFKCGSTEKKAHCLLASIVIFYMESFIEDRREQGKVWLVANLVLLLFVFKVRELWGQRESSMGTVCQKSATWQVNKICQSQHVRPISMQRTMRRPTTNTMEAKVSLPNKQSPVRARASSIQLKTEQNLGSAKDGFPSSSYTGCCLTETIYLDQTSLENESASARNQDRDFRGWFSREARTDTKR